MGKVYDYYPSTGHTTNEIFATLGAWLETMSKEERRGIRILATRYANVLPGLGVRGAMEFIWRTKELLNE